MKLLKFLHYLAGVKFSKRGHLSPVLKPPAIQYVVCSEKAQIMHLEYSRITFCQLEARSLPLRICICPMGRWLDPMLQFFRIPFFEWLDEAAGKKGIVGGSPAWVWSVLHAVFSTPEMRLMEASARLKPALCTPWLGAARASKSCLQVMQYASGNLAYLCHLWSFWLCCPLL